MIGELAFRLGKVLGRRRSPKKPLPVEEGTIKVNATPTSGCPPSGCGLGEGQELCPDWRECYDFGR